MWFLQNNFKLQLWQFWQTLQLFQSALLAHKQTVSSWPVSSEHRLLESSLLRRSTLYFCRHSQRTGMLVPLILLAALEPARFAEPNKSENYVYRITVLGTGPNQTSYVNRHEVTDHKFVSFSFTNILSGYDRAFQGEGHTRSSSRRVLLVMASWEAVLKNIVLSLKIARTDLENLETNRKISKLSEFLRGLV